MKIVSKMGKNNNFKPNILWICTDQQRYDTVNKLGNEYINTPNLNRLCDEGVAFTKAYCQSPVCTPSRASFLTGLYASFIHVNRNGNEYFPQEVKLISSMLADEGYKCGLIGKLHIASAWNGMEKRADDGYEVFHYSHDPYHTKGKANEYIHWLEEKGYDTDEIFLKNKKGEYYGYREIDPQLHQSSWCAEKATEFIRDNIEKPWLLNVNIFDPHPPFDAPEEYKKRYDKKCLPEPIFSENDIVQHKKLDQAFHQTEICRKPDNETKEMIASYYGMVELIDEQVGRILNILDETGQRGNTIVIFTSDHGEMLGDHGLIKKGCRFYEGAVRVPLIISWKDMFMEGVQSDQLVELTDIVPTIAEICGITLQITHGKSLLPMLMDELDDYTHRDYARCEYYDALNKYAPDFPEKNKLTFATMYFDGRYKLCVYHGIQEGELYDINKDPCEFNNLWDNESYMELKLKLLKKSFDATMIITDPGQPRIGRF